MSPLAPASTRLPIAVSDKFRFWSFVAMLGLVFVHGYTLEPRYLQPWTLPAAAPSVAGFCEYLIANALLRFRIPLLFVISGYLFALGDSLAHGQRLRQRLRTLGVPYLAWSLITLLGFALAEQSPTFRAWVAAAGIAQTGAQTYTVGDYAIGDWLLRTSLAPLPYQLWFIRALLFYNLLYPLLLRWVTRPGAARVFFPCAVLAWLASTQVVLLEGEGLLFFSLGVWLRKRGFDLERPPAWLAPQPWAALWLGAALTKTALAFSGLGAPWIGLVIVLLHKTCVFAGLVAAWFGADCLARAAMARPWFAWSSAFSFVIYASHAPLVAVLIDPMLAWTQPLGNPHLATFLLLPALLIAAAIALGAMLRHCTPRLYSLLTGGRGLA